MISQPDAPKAPALPLSYTQIFVGTIVVPTPFTTDLRCSFERVSQHNHLVRVVVIETTNFLIKSEMP